MTTDSLSMTTHGFAEQKALWRGQAGSIPSLLGGKAARVPLVFDLLKQVDEGHAHDLDAKPKLSFRVEDLQARQGGASPKPDIATWRQYYTFLRGLRLVENTVAGLHLAPAGVELRSDPTTQRLAIIFADRIRLFAEVLAVIAQEPLTVDEVDERIRDLYRTSWESNGGTRSRMDWQGVLGLIEPVGERRWHVTTSGRELLQDRLIVTPAIFDAASEQVVDIAEPPAEIAALLGEFSTSARTHDSRSTYNIWVPSPPSSPNKVENLRTIINAALHRIGREELFSFICRTYSLKRSSVDSMLPFLRASGILVEVGRGVFEATPAARAWIESGDDLNFIRILHANMRFVGEMIRVVENDVARNEMYAEASLFGLNVDKCRWIASFLLNTGLLEEPRYGSLRATPRGLAFLTELPLAEIPTAQVKVSREAEHDNELNEVRSVALSENLNKLSREPVSAGLASGKAFENAVRDVFLAMGFEARVISGSSDTDVLVQWANAEGSQITAIIEAKSRSVGYVAHTDISDVAIETHKNRHHAGFVAIVGPAFSGDTIKNMASQKEWVLLEAERLGKLAETSIAFGLRPYEIGQLFLAPNGLYELDDLLAARQRELDIVSFVLTKLAEEERESGEALSARDMSRDGRRTELAPSAEEIIVAIETMSQLQIDALRLIETADDPRFATYALGNAPAATRRLRALADAIERGGNDASV
ncbi:restriction endonuclease [Arthrobacter sp. YA7-1]|uniref:restriction endonuclease n=1 Tax=Arthrobacter sp. YA7-1 TaxID=2987701 RepID=UPI002226D24A|nr:restriction endonuclease [Arthrobacter sp. YA7-1]UYY83098.1 restriction endonuclease [Arthrobacter sp. YA7-1]